MDQRLLSIYIGNDVIRVVDATRKSATSIVINSVDEVSTPNGCVDDGYITDILEVASAIRSKIIGKSSKAKAVFTISSKKIASKEVVIPFVKGEKKVAAVLSANSSEYFPMSTTGDFIFAHNIMETFEDEEGKKFRINAVAAPKDLVEGYYELADELKLTVYDVDYVGNSVQQLLKLQMSNNEDDTNLVLQIEKDSTFVNVMAGRDIILQRSVPYGKNAVINSIMEIKKLTEKEAVELLRDKDRMERTVSEEEYSEAVRYLISSIGRIVEYHRSRNPERIIDGIKVFGEGASIAGIDEVLQQELGAEVTRFNSLQGIKVSQKSYLSSDQALRFLACFGAVLNPIGLKLDQGKNKENASENFNKVLYILLALAVVTMLGVCCWFWFQDFALTKAIELKEQQISDMEIAEQIYNEYKESVAAYNTVKEFADTTHNDNVMVRQFFDDLEKVLPTGAAIDEFDATDGYVLFTVNTFSKEAIAQLIVDIKSLDYVVSIELPEIEEHENKIDSNTGIEEVDEMVEELADALWKAYPYNYSDKIEAFKIGVTLQDPDYTPGVIVDDSIDTSSTEESAPAPAPVESNEDILEGGEL